MGLMFWPTHSRSLRVKALSTRPVLRESSDVRFAPRANQKWETALSQDQIVPGMVLKHQRPHFVVGLAFHNDEWCREFQYLEVAWQFLGVPHLAIARFEGDTFCGLGI